MIYALRGLFLGILLAMLYITGKAGMHENLWIAVDRLSNDPWAVATLWDAYFGFLTFFVWVAYKEVSLLRRAVWFVLIMCFGNIAMALYTLIQLFRVPAQASFADVVLRKART